MPKMVFRPSSPMPNAATIRCPSNGVASKGRRWWLRWASVKTGEKPSAALRMVSRRSATRTAASCPAGAPSGPSTSHTRPPDWNLLAHHHAVAAFGAPPAGRPFRLPLAALSGQSPDFFLHQQIHQLQTGLTDQLTHAFPQPAHHLGHGQDHLHRRISIRGHCLELLHCSLRFNLIWFLHSDSPFLGKRKLLSAYQKASSGESLLSTIYRASPHGCSQRCPSLCLPLRECQ